MRLKFASSSALLAFLLGIALLGWLIMGDVQSFRERAPQAEATQNESLPRVEVRTSKAQRYTPTLTLQGQLEPRRDVILRPRRAGTIAALPQEQGARVEAGDVLLELEQEDLPAQIDRVQAQLTLAQSELKGGRRLEGKNLISDNDLLSLESDVAEARAELANLRQRRNDTRITAPFDGVLDRLDVELGDFVQPGEDLGKLVEIEQLTATARAPQRRAPQLRVGLPVTATLLNGDTLEGELSFVASSADSATRSYALEAAIANPEHLRIAGASATLGIALPARKAHPISPALLILDDQGQLGVKYLDDEDRVRFASASILTADATRTWITGLPDRARLVTLGGGFVELGARVDPVPEDAERDS